MTDGGHICGQVFGSGLTADMENTAEHVASTGRLLSARGPTAAGTVSLRKVEARSYQHAVNDKRAPTRYEVSVDGVPVGEVWSRSTESWETTGRIRTRMAGFSRYWTAQSLPGVPLFASRYNGTRAAAVARLVAHHEARR